MTEKIFNVLFLCTGNSSRSIMAEALLNTMGNGRFRAYSAGSHPVGAVNPFAIEQVRHVGYPLENLRSKSWNEYAAQQAPKMDFVISVCDRAAGEVCPVWPGQPISAHWGFEDPTAADGDEEEKRQAFRKVRTEIKARLDIFLSLPLEKLERLAIKQELDRIGSFFGGDRSARPASVGSADEPAAPARVYKVLFVCTGNSSRSIMAEALLDILGQGRFKGYSAGSRPAGRVNPFAIEQIKAFDLDYPTEHMRSKSWDEFATANAPHMDFIVAVCDNAAGESSPHWPGRPASAHWAFEDPAASPGSDEERRAMFNKVFRQIMSRIVPFVALPLNTLEADAVRSEILAIGKMPV